MSWMIITPAHECNLQHLAELENSVILFCCITRELCEEAKCPRIPPAPEEPKKRNYTKKATLKKRVLANIREWGESEVHDVAERLGYHPTTINPILKELVAEKKLQRQVGMAWHYWEVEEYAEFAEKDDAEAKETRD